MATSPTEVREIIKKKFQKSGNMGKIFGAQTELPDGVTATDVAENTARKAHAAAQLQDSQLRGTSPQESLQPAPQEQESLPSGEEPVQEQPQEEQIPKSVFLKRVANDVRRRQEAEDKLATMEAQNVELLRQQQQPHEERESQTPQYEEGEEDGVVIQMLRQMDQRLARQEQATFDSRRAELHREALAAFGGNEDVLTIVNEFWRYGESGLSLKQALAAAAVDNPELSFDGPGDDGREDPSQYVQSGRTEQSGNRIPPQTEKDKDRSLVERLSQQSNQAARKSAGLELFKHRLSKHKIFSDRTQRSLR